MALERTFMFLTVFDFFVLLNIFFFACTNATG